MKKIVGYRKCLNHTLAKEWEWSCAVWFDSGMFADAIIKSTGPMKRKQDAIKEMKETLAKFGVTKETTVL